MYSLFGELRDAVTIFVIIALLIGSEVLTESRAKVAIAALAKITAVKTRVKRDQQIVEIDTLDVVPDDVLILSAGTKIAADARIQASIGLQVDESALTGESFPVEKHIGDEIYAGTFVAAAEGQAVVTVRGAKSRLGQIAAKTEGIEPPRTALQLAMKSLAGKLLYVALFFAISIPILGLLRGQDWKLMLLTGLALAFAIVPEELPIVILMVRGLGSDRRWKQHFLIKHLRTAEVVGSVTTIVTDNAGTITEGRLKIASTYPDQSKQVLEAAFLVTSEYAITPIDKIIREQAKVLNLSEPNLVRERDLGAKKTRATIRTDGSTLTLYVSGAPESVFAICSTIPDDARAELEQQTKSGRRVIAIASRQLAQAESQQSFDELEHGMNLSGLIAFEDSPRSSVKETIATAAKAGIRTIMVTGDHPLTAAFIADQVGINTSRVITGDELDQLSDEALRQTVQKVSIFARSRPEHKYRIVKALQANSEVVAVTGDGINDVLALKAADVGIAMVSKARNVPNKPTLAGWITKNSIQIRPVSFNSPTFMSNYKNEIRYSV